MMFTFLEYLFCVLKIFTFLYYANEGSDDFMGGFAKTAQHSITDISGNIKVVFFKLGTIIVHHKKKTQNDAHCVVAMTTVMLLVLF